MMKCLLFLIALILFTASHAQEDSVATSTQNSLLSFRVEPVEKVVLLKWAIEEGWEYKSFDIERTDDGVNYIKVGSRLGISKNSEGKYDFVDATPRRNITLHYRLKFISTDGHITYSESKETKVADAPWSVRLKQNPVRNNIELEVEASAAIKATVVVVSNAGQQVASQTFRLSAGKNGLSLSSQGMLQGLYQLIVEVGNERKTISIIKE